MVEFISSPVRFRPIKPRFWEREYGSEFLRSEFLLLKDFNKEKQRQYPEIFGTAFLDSRLGKHRFLLTPTPWLKQDCITCICPPSIPLPSNMSYIKVLGKRKTFQDRSEIIVNDIIPSKLVTMIEPEITFKDFQDMLLLQWGGIESPLRELLAFEIVSSPSIFQKVGGLNLSMYDGTGEGLSKKLLSQLKLIIPSDIAKEKTGSLKVPYMKCSIRLPHHPWSLKIVDADKPLSQLTHSFLSERRTGKCPEVSMTLGSDKQAPASLYDPPCALVDQPTLLPWNVEKLPLHVDPPLEITKYLIAMHFLYPTIGKTQTETNNVIDKARAKLFNLAKKSDAPHLVAKHGILDPNFYGKPQSIIRIALASARTIEKQMISSSDVIKAFDKYFVKNFQIISEAWPQLFTSKGVELLSPDMTELDVEILKLIDKNETKEIGVSYSAIEDHFFMTDPWKLRDSIERLQELGKIYYKKIGFYRVSPID